MCSGTAYCAGTVYREKKRRPGLGEMRDWVTSVAFCSVEEPYLGEEVSERFGKVSTAYS